MLLIGPIASFRWTGPSSMVPPHGYSLLLKEQDRPETRGTNRYYLMNINYISKSITEANKNKKYLYE
jgi:hypothetical protein